MRTIDIRAPDRREGCYAPFANRARRLRSRGPIAVLAKELIELNTAGRYTDLTAVGLGVTAGRHCALVSGIPFGISGLTDRAIYPHARHRASGAPWTRVSRRGPPATGLSPPPPSLPVDRRTFGGDPLGRSL